jgi:DNA-binding NarL/FixJ family response regulator
MKILIVEDDENKSLQLYNFFSEKFPQVEVENAQSLQGGLRKILDGGIDIILLDMTMPTFDIRLDEDGGRPQPYAGREILRQMDRRDIDVPVIVVTQFDRFGSGIDSMTLSELDKQLRLAHPENYKGAIYYDVSFGEWKDDLANKILRLQREKE